MSFISSKQSPFRKSNGHGFNSAIAVIILPFAVGAEIVIGTLVIVARAIRILPFNILKILAIPTPHHRNKFFINRF
jgi:hypothetical protein